MHIRCIILIICILTCASVSAQSDSVPAKLTPFNISDKVIGGLQKQYGNLQSKIHAKNEKLLAKMQRQENKLRAKMNRLDSTNADSIRTQELFSEDVSQRYKELQAKLTDSAKNAYSHFPLKEYVPGLDSVQTSLSFLLKNPNLPTDKLEKMKAVSEKLKALQGEMQKANDIQAFVREREAQLKERLMNTGLGKELTGINKQVYYYQAQLAEYKAMLNDKEKLKEKLLQTVRTLPAFQKFWQKNSYLAALFPAPSNITGGAGSLAGLQTRASVQNMIAQRVGGMVNTGAGGGAGMNPQQYFQGQVSAAQSQLNSLKDKLSRFSNGGGSNDMTMPDFKPNEQKTKSFFQRLEYGFNIQSQKGQYSLPTTSDLALTVGYKLDDSKRLGIGASYKMGWGNGLKDIRLSSEGIGLRSYIDIKSPIKSKGIFFNGLWLSGGFEYNYLSGFRNLRELRSNVDVWQQSALMGLSKKYKIGKKEGNMQVLYDFLHGQQNPPAEAIKFRLGYQF